MTKRKIDVLPSTYQPTKAEKDERFRVDASPEDLARALLRPVEIKARDVAEYRAHQKR